MTTRATAIIPARMGSTRFPRKALADETGRALVVHVCERAALAGSVERVVVACDAEEIASVVRAAGFEAVLTSESHENGTSRLAEACETLEFKPSDLIINVQGDEPEIEPEIVDAAALAVTTPWRRWTLAQDAPCRDACVPWVGTVASPFADGEDPADPNIVKAVTGLLEPGRGVGPALYFSRSPVPADRDGGSGARPLKHVGIYAYTLGALRHCVGLEPSPLEGAERLEQLRWLEHGCAINVAVRHAAHHGIDTPEQYAAFVERWKAANA